MRLATRAIGRGVRRSHNELSRHGRELLSELLDRRPDLLDVRHGPSGRPFVRGLPVDVSIAHKDDLVVVGAVDRPARIGVDVEWLDADIDWRRIADHLLDVREQSLQETFAREENLSLASAFAVFWAIKESFFKCADCRPTANAVRITAVRRGEAWLSPAPAVVRDLERQGSCADRTHFRCARHHVLAWTVSHPRDARATGGPDA
jgi:hypothetical protein